MKRTLILLIGLAFCTCTTVKDKLQSGRKSALNDLVELILSESFNEDEKVCLYASSISFDFRFPDSFNGGAINLSNEEMKIIEEEFKKNSVKWNDILQKKYKSTGPNCLHMSRPIIFRNGLVAFVYISQFGAEFYNVYEKIGTDWRFKENLITLIN